jgi:hypothetical protein
MLYELRNNAMKLSDLNEYLQTIAAIGAIIALAAVGYEIRQSNRIATQQQLSNNWSTWVEHAGNSLDSGIAETLAKSMAVPGELSLEEKIDLDFYLSSYFYLNHQNYISLLYDSNSNLAELVLQDMAGDAPLILGSAFARAWFLKNVYWMAPEIVSRVEKALEDHPLGSDLHHYDSIDALAETLRSNRAE